MNRYWIINQPPPIHPSILLLLHRCGLLSTQCISLLCLCVWNSLRRKQRQAQNCQPSSAGRRRGNSSQLCSSSSRMSLKFSYDTLKIACRALCNRLPGDKLRRELLNCDERGANLLLLVVVVDDRKLLLQLQKMDEWVIACKFIRGSMLNSFAW